MSIIKPKKTKTRNIPATLEKFAEDNSISVDACSYNINSVTTYIKTSSDTDFELFNEDINIIYKDKTKLANEHVKLKQLYIITIKEKTKEYVKLNYSIDYGKYSTHPVIIIEPDSVIPYKKYKPKDILILLAREINRIKAQNGMLINIFDSAMIKTLKLFTKHVCAGKFTKKVKIPLFEGLKPEVTRESKLIMWFEEKKSDHGIIEVEEGEKLVEFKKPKYGKNGFNVFGKQVDDDFGKNVDDLDAFVDSNTIEIVEDDNKKIYMSKLKGYVLYNKDSLKVDNKIKMAKISRVQSTLAKEEDNNIEVHVSQNDTTQDSVGEGVHLTSEIIHINGHVGSKSKIEAVNLTIDGATHQNSLQYAKHAKINRHKGTLRCHEAKIVLLEGGEVHATNVDIETSLGGTIYAQDVKIAHVKSNLKVYASNSITLKLVSGEDNLFKINYKDIPVLAGKIKWIHREIEDLEYELEQAQMNKQEKVPDIKKKISVLKTELGNIRNSARNAKITINNPLHGLNTINFTLNTDDELVYKTDAKSYDPFYLEFEEDKITLHPVGKKLILE